MNPENNLDKIEMMLNLMEYDFLTDSQLDWVVRFESQYERRGSLTDPQFETLADIFRQAAEK